MNFSDFLIGLHNLLRWFVLLGGVLAVITMLSGLSGRKFGPGDRRAGLIYTISLDLQLLVGLILLWLSPLTGPLLRDMSQMGAAMSNPDLRFFIAEHPVLMIIAVIVAHIGSSQTRKAGLTDRARFTRGGIFYGLSLVLVLAAIPWGRTLIPWF